MLSPFRGFVDLQGEMNRMIDEMFGESGREVVRQRGSRPSRWSPVVDVLVREGDLVVRAELPGVSLEDVEITLQNGVLTISGERMDDQQKDGQGFYVRERRYGTFRRSMTLPEGVDDSKVRASFEDGVLEVTVEGAAVAQEPKRIQIEGSSNGSQS